MTILSIEDRIASIEESINRIMEILMEAPTFNEVSDIAKRSDNKIIDLHTDVTALEELVTRLELLTTMLEKQLES